MSTLSVANITGIPTSNLGIVNATSLGVSGATALIGAATFANTIAVTGNAVFSNTIAVTGNATFSNTVNLAASGIKFSDATTMTTAAVAGSLTLLATLTTTSGTTQSATGLATTYTNLLIVYEGVSNSTSGDDLRVAVSVDNGSTYGSALGTQPLNTQTIYGASIIFRANASTINKPFTYIGSLSYGQFGKIVATSAAPINALRFTFLSGYTFSAGAIYIYGWN